MGCNQSADTQWAYSNHGLPLQNVDTGTIEEYLELEKTIAEAEKTSPGFVLQQKRNLKAHIQESLDLQKQRYEDLQHQTELLKGNEELLGSLDAGVADVEVKQMLMGLGEEKEAETREALAAFNNKEISKTEVDNLQEQLTGLNIELSSLEHDAAQLQTLYTRQDELLARIFGGDYGSLEENRLEQELDHHEEMRNRIVEANFKWRQAQLMVDYAFKQLVEAVRQWELLPGMEHDKLDERYGVACIARNNLVAAAQNIQGAQRYLTNVQFPYCAPPEVATLNKATVYIFTDMQTTDRHQHALDCYSITQKRCGALLQWINQVVHTTIAKDLEDINKKVKVSSMALRTERVRMIKIRAKEVTGKDVDIKVADINTDVDIELNFNDLARTEGIDPSLLEHLTEDDLATIRALSDDDLAPPPSEEDIFGKVELIKGQYKEETDKYMHHLQENQARVKDSLQQKLMARKQRRARKNVEAKEKAAYSG